MSVKILLDDIPVELHEKLAKDLLVVPINPAYEMMKKIGKISAGYTPDPTKNISVYDIITEEEGKYILLPKHYAKRFEIKKVENYKRLTGVPEIVKYESSLRKQQIPHALTCLEQLFETESTTVSLPPGFGKTFIGSWLSYHLELMTIVIVPRGTLLAQWKHTFNSAIPRASVWVVGVDEDPTEIPDVIICMDQRIKKIPLAWKNKIGTMIIDEAHMIVTASRISNLLSISPKYIILESATLERDDGLHKICHLLAGEHGVFVVSTDPYKLYNVDLPFIEGKEVSTSMGVSYPRLCSSLAQNELYNHVIVNIVKQNLDKKFILLTRLVSHAHLLKKMFISEGIKADTLAGNQKKYDDSKVLIGTMGKIGVGFDESTASETFAGIKSDAMIMCHSVKSPKNFEQFRGRIMRVANPTIYWLNPLNRNFRSHLTGLKKWITETNGTIIKIDGKQFI